jgi:predicted PurR-regulated permease PerM
LLYVGRPILVPVTLAVVLSFAIAPPVRLFSRLGLGYTSSALTAVSLSGAITLLLALVIGLQTLELASGLPQYEAAIASKISRLRVVTLARLEPVQGAAGRILGPFVVKWRYARRARQTCSRRAQVPIWSRAWP